ncbi:uncharacterized protein F5Z01DRAFT_654301 [Emericellopsis atlantica]|uniref:Uncharacterized protein n=1 Tax=Emericellopsis atlantica TaxID=2614577 RepID=A0A9P7ZMT8_9HYPO|nr:uncharacterized protein F5Z01DRAFT_654301 [Emericellopsis atlantica]KAG9254597.1 hypothetical protein F5Z01DRAFT_654301 [Emericellopsis atlantica]
MHDVVLGAIDTVGCIAVGFPAANTCVTQRGLFIAYSLQTEEAWRRTKRRQKHTTAGIRWSSPTQLLISPLAA